MICTNMTRQAIQKLFYHTIQNNEPVIHDTVASTIAYHMAVALCKSTDWQVIPKPSVPGFSFTGDCGTSMSEHVSADGVVTPLPRADSLQIKAGGKHSLKNVAELLDTPDAHIWAKEFVKYVQRDPTIATDEGTMIGWFANAMMSMHDHDARSNATSNIEKHLRQVIRLEHENLDRLETQLAQANSARDLLQAERDTLTELLQTERNENKRLQACLDESKLPAGMASTKPEPPEVDWSALPKWANWVALEASGWWFWYDEQPHIIEDTKDGWAEIDRDEDHYAEEHYGGIPLAYAPVYSGPWQDSLTQRP